MYNESQTPKILVVDDHPENILAIEKILKKLDADIIKANTGNEALAATLDHEFALILLDVQMPEMTGYEVAEFLKGDERTEDIPIIFITAIDRDNIQEIQGYETGAVDFIFKPLNEFILISKVKIFLEIYKSRYLLENLVNERTSELSTANTELVKKNIQLKKSEQQYRTLFEKTNDAIFIIQKQTGEILDANQAGMDLTGLEIEALKQVSITDIVSEGGNDLLSAISKTEPTGTFGRVLYKQPNNELRITNMNIVELDNSSAIGIAKDITHDIEIEKQLRQTHKMEAIGTLAGGIAHDFNNILTPILGFSQIVFDDLPDGGRNKKMLAEVRTAALRASELVQQILTFSRETEQELKPVNMPQIVEEAFKLIKASLPSSIEIKEDISKNCGLVLADPTQIHQITMNLSTNAFHAMEGTSGTLEVCLQEVELSDEMLKDSNMDPGKYACLSVSDTGKGIDPNHIESIFNPYFTTKEQGKGTGFGLSIVHSIIKSYNGDIKVYSEFGKGTVFKIFLPILDLSVEKGIAIKPIEELKGNERILLVDDEPSILRMQDVMLSRLGYKVTTTNCSMDAFEIFRENPSHFDLVISDLTMPKMTGDVLAKKILEIRPDIPILICSGFSDRLNEKQAKNIGLRGFVMKPIIKNELAKTIRKALGDSID